MRLHLDSTLRFLAEFGDSDTHSPTRGTQRCLGITLLHAPRVCTAGGVSATCARALVTTHRRASAACIHVGRTRIMYIAPIYVDTSTIFFWVGSALCGRSPPVHPPRAGRSGCVDPQRPCASTRVRFLRGHVWPAPHLSGACTMCNVFCEAAWRPTVNSFPETHVNCFAQFRILFFVLALLRRTSVPATSATT